MGEEVELPLPCSYLFRRLHHLCHEADHSLGGFVLLLAGGVGVGMQGEAIGRQLFAVFHQADVHPVARTKRLESFLSAMRTRYACMADREARAFSIEAAK